MQSLNLYGVEDLRFEDSPCPELKHDTDVRIAVAAVGICGSDLSRYKKLGPYIEGMTFGHEFSGVITEVGSAVTHVDVGQRVVGCPAIVCHACASCEKGEYSRCSNLYVIGSYQPGAFAEEVVLPAENVIPIPDDVDDETAAMIEPSAVVAHGFYRTRLSPGNSVAIMGCGSIGLLAVQWARIFGATQIIAIDIADDKLRLASELGATETLNARDATWEDVFKTWCPNGVDLAIESSGVPKTFGQVLTLPCKGGEVLMLGIPYADMQIPRRQFEKILRNELSVHGSWNGLSAPFPGQEWHASIDYMRTGDINVTPMITKRLPLSEGPRIFKTLTHGQHQLCKVMFKP